MTLSVDIPAEGGWLGGGYTLQVRTTLFGPFPSTYHWELQVESAQPLQRIYFARTEEPITSVVTHVLYQPQPPGVLIDRPVNGAAFSASAQVTAQMRDFATNTVIDGPKTFPGFFWDPIGGVADLIYLLNPISGGDGFNASDRQQLLEVHTAVSKPSYSTSALHVNLSGGGTITFLTKARAIRWTVETFPPNVAVDPGTPNYYFNLGFITPLVPSAALKSSRVSLSPQELELPQACTGFSYDLAPFVVLEVAELTIP